MSDRVNRETKSAREHADETIKGFRGDVAAGHLAYDDAGFNELANRMADVIQGDRDRIGELLRYYGLETLSAEDLW